MTAATLADIELNRAYLAAELVFNGYFKRLTGSGKIFMTENVGSSALCSLSEICTVGKTNQSGGQDKKTAQNAVFPELL